MNITLLTPIQASNEWFVYVNSIFERKIRELGHDVDQILFENIDLDLVKQIESRNSDFYISQSGIGSDIRIFLDRGGEKNFWEHSKRKVCLLHFDHPFQCLSNHSLDASNCLHVFSCKTYFDAANLFVKKKKSPKILLPNPLLVDEEKLSLNTGDSFSIIKNYFVDKIILEKRKTDKVLNFHCNEIVSLVNEYLIKNDYFNHHDFLLSYFSDNDFGVSIGNATVVEFFKWFQSEVSLIKLGIILKETQQFKVNIFGVGLSDKFEETKKRNFFSGLSSNKSQELYYSNFGIIDFSPCEGLHDRSQRSLFNERPFLSGTDPKEMNFYKNYSEFFFNFSPNNLLKKCEMITCNPNYLKEKVIQFKKDYTREFSWENYLNVIIKNLNLL